ETIQKYRLGSSLGNGKRSFLRRTYTCPLFVHKELGCPLPAEAKPYGCLAFNSHHPEKKASEECYSEKDLLRHREEAIQEEGLHNLRVAEAFQLSWAKATIPEAILDLWDEVPRGHEFDNGEAS